MVNGTLGSKKCGEMITDINVTPLVDIMLVLLIIFMVTTSYIVRESLAVSLPEASSGEPHKVSILAITLDRQGQLSLNGELTSDDKIRTFIREQRAAGVELEAVIAADKAARHGQVVQLIDLVHKEGVKKFAINVLRPEP